MLSGCPGGATGLRIEPMMDGFRFPRFAREDFMDVGLGAISNRNASCLARDCQSVPAIGNVLILPGYLWRDE